MLEKAQKRVYVHSQQNGPFVTPELQQWVIAAALISCRSARLKCDHRWRPIVYVFTGITAFNIGELGVSRVGLYSTVNRDILETRVIETLMQTQTSG